MPTGIAEVGLVDGKNISVWKLGASVSSNVPVDGREVEERRGCEIMLLGTKVVVAIFEGSNKEDEGGSEEEDDVVTVGVGGGQAKETRNHMLN